MVHCERPFVARERRVATQRGEKRKLKSEQKNFVFRDLQKDDVSVPSVDR